LKGITKNLIQPNLIKLIEEIYNKSCRLQLWSIVRQSAALLGKNVGSLTSAIVDLLIRQKQITLGELDNEYVIANPVSPSTILDLITKYYKVDDIREASLVQEILIFLGSMIRVEPNIFNGFFIFYFVISFS